MDRLKESFQDIRKRGTPGVIPYLTVGFPTIDETLPLLSALVDGGADAIELGVPFSDPLADGPTIQRASMRSLAGGTRLSGVLEMVGEVRSEMPDAPLVLMTYYNPIVAMGLAEFVRGASRVANALVCSTTR